MAQIKIDGSARFCDVLVPRSFIREHMHAASGDHIKVYLMLLDAAQHGTEFNTSAIADLWETTEKDVNRSLSYWEKKGLIVLEKNGRTITGVTFPSDVSSSPVARSSVSTESLPSATENNTDVEAEAESESVSEPDAEVPVEAESDSKNGARIIITPEMYREAENNENFQMLLAVTQKYFNKLFSRTDYDLFIHFYYRMNCNTDICEMIVECCADKGKPNMRSIDKLSCELLENRITSREAIRYYLNRKQISEKFIEILGLSCKKLPAAQMNYLNKWFLELHFSEAMVTEACNRGALKTNGDNSFPYIDSILESWYSEGLTSLEDVSKKDEAYKEEQQKKYASKSSKSAASGGKSKNKFNDFSQTNDYNFDEDELLFIADNNVKKDDDNS